MSRVRDIANILSGGSSAIATDAEIPSQVAGKNKIINGDFSIWQRGTTFNNIANLTYSADRWFLSTSSSGHTINITRQDFAPGTIPQIDFQYFLRFQQTVAGTNAGWMGLEQRVENVRTLAGQTVTISFWAKADSSSRTIQIAFNQAHGGLVQTVIPTITLSTSWQRYSATVNLPSMSGRSVSDGSYLAVFFGFALQTVQTIELAGIQLEAGSVATPFTTATGNPQAELAACQRYYYRWTPTAVYQDAAVGYNASANTASCVTQFPVEMRIAPTGVEQSGTASHYNVLHMSNGNPARTVCNAVPNFQSANKWNARTYFQVASGLTAGQGSMAGNDNNTVGYLGWSAEL